MNHRFKAILFDLDGTIIDSLSDLQKAINGLLVEEKRRPLDHEEIRACTGDGLRIMLGKAFSMTGQALEDKALEALMPRYLAIYAAITPQPSCIYDGMLAFLAEQKKAGIKLGLCTNKHEVSTRRIMRQLELDTFFDIMVGGDTLIEKKPHPMPLLHALKICGVTSDEAVMIGDSPNDTRAAAAAGMPSILARYGYTPDWPVDAPFTHAVACARDLPEALHIMSRC